MLETLETHVLILNICAQAILEHICIQRSKMLIQFSSSSHTTRTFCYKKRVVERCGSLDLFEFGLPVWSTRQHCFSMIIILKDPEEHVPMSPCFVFLNCENGDFSILMRDIFFASWDLEVVGSCKVNCRLINSLQWLSWAHRSHYRNWRTDVHSINQ